MSELPKKIIGLTGNIASGKSEVTKYLQDKGYKVIDTDLITKSIYLSNDEFKIKLAKLLGNRIIKDDKIDKQLVSSIVFNDRLLLEKLNELIHPIIKEYTLNEIRYNNGLVFIDAPLLFEADFEKICDYVITIAVDEDIQIDRLIKRNGLTIEEAKKRIDSQMAQSLKIKNADYVLYNNGTISELHSNVDKILEELERGL